ncbi:DUF6191 domain-containing protein [Streptomyces sp. NPDC058221]|uniref:DUF6191 domain-containing protein n=1 Tax=Streptomyces sp. NPDC058221 TaxID=3346388 RepID=UPI0036F05A40
MFNFFEELFAPGRKHAAEEQRRLELSRVDLGIGDPARGPIDLTSGKVVVRRPDTGGEDPGAPDLTDQDASAPDPGDVAAADPALGDAASEDHAPEGAEQGRGQGQRP